MSSEKLENCEEDLKALLEDIRTCLVTHRGRGRSLERKLAEGEALLHNLQAEVTKAPLFYQQEVSIRVLRYESELGSLKRRIEQSDPLEYQQPLLEDDDPFQDTGMLQLIVIPLCLFLINCLLFAIAVFVGPHFFHESNMSEERVHLLKDTDTLNRASASLHRAQKVSAQTDEMAVNIMDELGGQKSSLVRTRKRLSDIDLETKRSHVLTSTLACKALQNRIILISIIVMEVLVLFGVLFYKLYKRFK